ncbi:MAG: sigma-70 family RNA polymerase sigma factor [Woeseiaceae bacterium]|nr:sigma-70 family RNA polymerase sigma factor [Woeseiaceae bacterium]
MAALSAVANTLYSEAAVTTTEHKQTDEALLIRRAKNGDQRAFEALYRSNVDKVYALCLRMTGNVSEAEDCAQEAFIQAWNQLSKFRGDSAFSTWMHRIAVNAVLGRMRKSKRDQNRLEIVADRTEVAPLTSDEGALRDLSEAIDRLPDGARHVFVLHAVYGYSHDEAGSMLGIATGTSKAQVHRARRLLAQQLKQEGFTE